MEMFIFLFFLFFTPGLSCVFFFHVSLSAGMHTSISEILKEKTLKSSRRSLPCLAQSQTHPENLNHFLSVPLSPEPKTYSHSVSASCTHIIPPTGEHSRAFLSLFS